MKPPAAKGFTLLETAAVIAIIFILVGILIPLLSGLLEVDQSVKAYDELKRVYTAIVGTPGTANYGYLGDVGDYPTSLMDLVRDPGDVDGWNGPYLTDVVVENGMLLDAFGTPIEFFFAESDLAEAEKMAVISKGPDRESSNTSVTPNDWTTYAGLPSPADSSYGSTAGNTDNIVYPRLTENLGMLSYNSVGQLNLNILNYDNNSKVAQYVPACPNMFEIKVTSVTRPNDTFGGPATDSTPVYSPGGASFDLMQGAYRVQVRQRFSPNVVVSDEVLGIVPGANLTRTYQLPGPDSSLTSSYDLFLGNNSSDNLTIYSGAAVAGTAAAMSFSDTITINGCSQMTVRKDANGGLVDTFVMPIGLAFYLRTLDTTTFTYTVTNNGDMYRYLFVYVNDLLAGEVSGWGTAKVKQFKGLKSGDQLLIKDQTGFAPDPAVTISMDDGIAY
jgi:type II secretory pathway pseudopilin PulG